MVRYFECCPASSLSTDAASTRPLLAAGVVRYVGEPIVAVVAENRYLAADAAELVVVDYEALPVVIDPEDVARHEVLLFPAMGTNTMAKMASKTEAKFQGSEVVVAQGVAQALMEAIVVDADGNPLTSNFADCQIISAAELLSFEVLHLEPPTLVNELGAKGVGESGTIGAIPAVYDAVVDAVAHLGIRQLYMPLTPPNGCGRPSPRPPPRRLASQQPLSGGDCELAFHAGVDGAEVGDVAGLVEGQRA